jgi:inner membrane protein
MPELLGSYYLFVLVGVVTHAAVGYTIGAVAFDRPKAGLLAGVLADADFVFRLGLSEPFVHRGITHTLVVALVFAALTVRFAGRPAGLAAGLGYLSHLAIDITTPKGIPLLYPVGGNISLDIGLRGHSLLVTAVFWGLSLAVLAWRTPAVPPAGWAAD